MGFFIHICFPFPLLAPASLVTPPGSAFLLPAGRTGLEGHHSQGKWKGSHLSLAEGVPRTQCWGTSRGCPAETEPFLLLLQAVVTGEGWSQPGMLPEPGRGGSSETGTRDTKQEDGMSLPGQQRLPRLRRDSLGSEHGFGFGHAQRGCPVGSWLGTAPWGTLCKVPRAAADGSRV